MVEFDVSSALCIHDNGRFWLKDDTFHDDAAAVVFKPTPLHPGLCAGALVVNGHIEVDGVARLHAERHVLEITGEVHGVVFRHRVNDLADGGAVNFSPADGHAVRQGGGFFAGKRCLAGAGLGAPNAFENGGKKDAHLHVGVDGLLNRWALKAKHGNRPGRDAHGEAADGGVGLTALEDGFLNVKSLDVQPFMGHDGPFLKTGFVGGFGVGHHCGGERQRGQQDHDEQTRLPTAHERTMWTRDKKTMPPFFTRTAPAQPA